MFHGSFRVLALAGAIVLTGAGCVSSSSLSTPTPLVCQKNVDCGEGDLTCVNGSCRALPLDTKYTPSTKVCQTGLDCGEGDLSCVNGFCTGLPLDTFTDK